MSFAPPDVSTWVDSLASIKYSLDHTSPENLRNQNRLLINIKKERLNLAAEVMGVECGMGMHKGSSAEECIDSILLHIKEDESKGLFLSEVAYWMAVEYKLPGSLNLLYCPLCEMDKNFRIPFTFEQHFNQEHNILYREISCPFQNCHMNYSSYLKPRVIEHITEKHGITFEGKLSYVLMKSPSRLAYKFMANTQGTVIFPTGRLCQRQKLLPSSVVPLKFNTTTGLPIDSKTRLKAWDFNQIACKDKLMKKWPRPIEPKRNLSLLNTSDAEGKQDNKHDGGAGIIASLKRKRDGIDGKCPGSKVHMNTVAKEDAAEKSSFQENMVPTPIPSKFPPSFPDEYRNWKWPASKSPAKKPPAVKGIQELLPLQEETAHATKLVTFNADMHRIDTVLPVLIENDTLCVQNFVYHTTGYHDDLFQSNWRFHTKSNRPNGVAIFSKEKPLKQHFQMDVLRSASEEERKKLLEFRKLADIVTVEFNEYVLCNVDFSEFDQVTLFDQVKEYLALIAGSKPYVITSLGIFDSHRCPGFYISSPDQLISCKVIVFGEVECLTAACKFNLND